MDPPEPPSTVDNGHEPGEEAAASATGDADAAHSTNRQPADPPEETFAIEMARSSYRSSGKNYRPPPRRQNNKRYTGRAVLRGADNQIDDFEMEGLIMTSSSRQTSFSSSLGAGSVRSTTSSSSKYCAPLMAICSLAFSSRYRARSTIALLFLVFLCFIYLTKNDANAMHGASSDSDSHRKSGKFDPFSELSPDQRASLLKQTYGSWRFYDGGAEDRPTTPYLTEANAGNPYLDLTEDKFPEESWQADAVYANHFLDAAEKLVRRGQQAIFTAYHGYGITGTVKVVKNENGGEEGFEYTEENADERITQRMEMFQLQEVDLATVTNPSELQEAAPNWERKSGWTTQRSWDGLERRITHAMMTRKKFTVVITGSWQSMGYGGNHVWQSMAGVFETLLKGIFQKMEIDLVVRAVGLPPYLGGNGTVLDGGKSTLVHTLGWSSIYGSDVDMVVWDDYQTTDDGEPIHELDELSKQLFDLFARQALLSGDTTLPFIWGGDLAVLRNLHEHADVDVGQLGNALLGVPETKSEKAAYNLPWAARYLNCPKSMKNACKQDMYNFESTCWITRPDVEPSTQQLDHISILPSAIGWRMQQIKGYTLAYTFLQATLDAINQYSEITISQGFPLPDEYWHIGDYIKNVQEKVKALDEAAAPHCFQLEEKIGLPKRLCKSRLRGRTEFTPRANPEKTGIKSLLLPKQEEPYSNTLPPLLYDKDDVEVPIRKVPKGEVDAVEIFDLQGKRRRLQRMLRMGIRDNEDTMAQLRANRLDSRLSYEHHRRAIAITPGEGWQSLHSYGDGCDGTLLSSNTCGRLSSSNCLLEGHQGSRGGIWGNETTSWLVLREEIKPENGFIALSLEFGSREQRHSGRALQESSLPDSFVFEYAIGAETSAGLITALDKSTFLEKSQQPVPGMVVLTVLDNVEAKEVDSVSIRITGCAEGPECQYAVTHVYWS